MTETETETEIGGAREVVIVDGTEVAIGRGIVTGTEIFAVTAIIIIVGGTGVCRHLDGTVITATVIGTATEIEEEVEGIGVVAQDGRDIKGTIDFLSALYTRPIEMVDEKERNMFI